MFLGLPEFAFPLASLFAVRSRFKVVGVSATTPVDKLFAFSGLNILEETFGVSLAGPGVSREAARLWVPKTEHCHTQTHTKNVPGSTLD